MERLHAVLFNKVLYRRANTAVSCKLSRWRIQEIFGNKRKMIQKERRKGEEAGMLAWGPLIVAL